MKDSFFKKIPYRLAHPGVSTDYDGYYAIVPRSNRYSRKSPGAKAIERIARARGISFEQTVRALQRECDERVQQLVAKDAAARRGKAKRNKGKGKRPNKPKLVAVNVVTTTRTYVGRHLHERELVREVVRRERVLVPASDYGAFPLNAVLSINRAKGGQE